LHGRSLFSFLRSLHTVFHRGCSGLPFHQQCMRFLSLHPHQHWLSVVFLVIAILTGVKWNLNVVLICISFMARDGDQFFMCFLAIWTPSVEKCIQFICPFLCWVIDSLGV
jgi:hypothetical protein